MPQKNPGPKGPAHFSLLFYRLKVGGHIGIDPAMAKEIIRTRLTEIVGACFKAFLEIAAKSGWEPVRQYPSLPGINARQGINT